MKLDRVDTKDAVECVEYLVWDGEFFDIVVYKPDDVDGKPFQNTSSGVYTSCDGNVVFSLPALLPS